MNPFNLETVTTERIPRIAITIINSIIVKLIDFLSIVSPPKLTLSETEFYQIKIYI